MLPGFDRRETGAGDREKAVQAAREGRRQAAARLREEMPMVRVDFDERLGSPRFVGSPTGFLTGTGGQGGAVPPERTAAFPVDDVHRATKAFMTEHAALFSHGPELLDEALVSRDYVTSHNGLRTTVWQQVVDGVRVFESTLQAHVTAKGELVNIASRFVPDPRTAAETGMPEAPRHLSQPPVDARLAISVAAASTGDKVPSESVAASGQPAGLSRKQAFTAPALLDLSAEYVWLPLDESAMRLCWEIIFMSRTRGEMFRTLVDAASGEALLQQRLTEYISPASYRVFTGDSPTPMSPGHATPQATQPPQAARQLVTLDALDPTASPNGWINDGITETRGNNVDAHLDRNADNVADTPRPQSTGTARVFDPPLDLAAAPSTYGDAAVVNLFYWNNLIHDRYHALGFTEAAGNFQLNNFGRGGLGNDAVQADAQDGSGTNNANFSTPADGSPGRMQMYNFTGPNPDRDGDFDQEIIIHEYTHGLSNRLVGGGVGMSALQSRGMGEGWSDFYGLCLLSEVGDDPNGTYAAGAYASYQLSGLSQNYYFGIRRYPYSTNLLKNPLTFKDIDPGQASVHPGVPKSPLGGGTADQVHNQGEVWCVTLWDVRANLIAKHGAAAGNELVLRLVTDGMKLAPANPNFVQARDAILQAELVYSGGANRNELWSAFAKRGLGAGASSPGSGTTGGLVESFDFPDTLSVTPSTLAMASGSIGGPFTPGTFPFSLYNAGTAAMPWTVTSSEGWLTVPQTGGTLVAGGQIQLEASLNAAAATLQAGNHVATVTFTNHDTGISQTRTVVLHVDYLFVPVYLDDFESGTLDPAFWTITGTGPHRTQVTTANGPRNGARHLTEDSTTDGTYARNEATLSLNLTGQSDLVLRFWVKMFNDEPESPPTTPIVNGADFDGVAISTDGTNWYEVQPLRSLTNDWQQISVDLDAAIAAHGLTYGPNFKIRFNHYDNFAIPTDGFAFDDVMVAKATNRRLQISLTAAATEGSAALTGTMTVTPKPDTPLQVDLASSDASEAAVPPSIVIPADASSATFAISFPDDSELDGTQLATITATAATFVPGAASVAVHDTETAVISLDVPATATEGGGALTGTVNLSAPPAQNVRVALASGEIGDVLVPASVEMPAGQTSVPFVITVVDDGRIDGIVNAPITAHVENWTGATASIAIGDNEAPVLAIEAPDVLREGDPVGSGTVSLPGTLPVDLVVSLAGSDPSEATVPASVTIYAGETSASFGITVVDDSLLDGAQPVTLTASAGGFPENSISTTVTDNDAASFALSPIGPSQIRNAPIPVTLTAHDIDGAIILNYAGTLSFTAENPSGSVPCSPATGSGFVDGLWTGNVTIGEFADAVRLTAGIGGITVTSDPFTVGRGPMSRLGWAQIASPQTIDTPFNVSLRAEDAGGNLVDDFTGAVALSALSPGPGAATGTETGTNSDLDTFYTQSRFQCIYPPAEVGTAGRLTALQLDLSRLPEIPLENFTIRVKHTPLSKYSNSTGGWETTGWTVVYSSNTGIGQTGWFTFPFLEPFDYDGSRNLMVDFSYNSADSPSFGNGAYRATMKPERRRLYYKTIFNSDPLTWSDQTTPSYSSAQVPNLRFVSYQVTSPIRPATTGAFSGGLWNGIVSVPFTTTGVKLLADDGDGRTGTSNDFAVEAAKPLTGLSTLTENFERLPLKNVWAFTGTYSYRTVVSAVNAPHGGTGHLVMDSSGYQTSRNEATWTVDLTGLKGVTLKFWAKRGYSSSPYQNAPPNPFTNGADFDGVAISANGTTWYEIQPLRTLTSTWTQYSVNLDSAISSFGLAYNSAFKIRFNRYGYDAMPYNGIAVDDIEITSTPSPYALKVTGPAQIREGDDPALCAVTLPFASPTDTVVTLASSALAKAIVPAQVTVPAGRLSASFPVQPVSDSLPDGSKTVAITATSPVFPAGSLSLVVLDNDQHALTFIVPTTNAVEGGAAIQGTVSIATLPAAPTVLNVTSSTPTAISVPATITIPLGATSVTLPLTVVNDTKVDGPQSATIVVSEPGGGLSQSVTITVADDETLDLQLLPATTPAPTSVNESAGSMTFSAKLPGTVTTATTLTFGSSAPSLIIPPASANISAGGTSTSVTFTIVDDAVALPSEPVTLTVSAPGFNSSSYVISYLDNDPHHFTIAPIASPQVRGAPFPVTVTACDAAGATLPGFIGPVTLGTNGPAIQPSLLTGFVAGVWNGTIRVNEIGDDVVLTIASPMADSGSSNPFDVGPGAFQQLVWEPVAPKQTPASDIAVTLKAADAGGNIDPTVNEPVTVQALTPIPALTIGTGSGSTSSFLYSYYARARSEVLYLASEIGGRRTLGGIALNVKSGAAGQLLSNFTIRLKTTTRTKLDSSTGWDGDGWTVVHQSNQMLTANGWITLLFDVPFEYDGRENLLADYSYNSATSPNDSVEWAADYSTSYDRLLYGYTSSATDPLTWSGTSQYGYTSSYVPRTRLLTLQPVPANFPASPAISAGIWNGVVSFGGNVDRVFLDAVDSSGRHGVSNAFRIGSPNLPVATPLPFSDGFETGLLTSIWTPSSTAYGRVNVISTNAPHNGSYHAVLDSSSGTARTELTLPLDLSGYTGVSLSFWAKRFDSTNDGPPASPFTGGADFDGVAMSADGISWYEIQPLRGMTTGTWTAFTVDLDAAAATRGLVYTSNFRIRFNHYGNDYVPYDGIAIDDVSVTGNPTNRLSLSLPTWIIENAPPAPGTIDLPAAAATDTTVELASSSPLALAVPPSVVIPAGQLSTTFPLTPVNNATVSGPISVSLTATASGITQAMATTEVRDDDTGTFTLSVPSSISESAGTTDATLTVSPPAVGNLVVSLTSSLPASVQVPATVQLQPGQTAVNFPLTITNDSKQNSPQNVTLSATLTGWPTATTFTTVIDDEDGTLSWPSSASVNEGGTKSITLYTDGSLSSSMVVSLTSDSPRLTLPATVTIPTGASSVSVTVTGVQNSAVEGTQYATITASAAGLASASRTVSVYDNDAHHFTFAPISSRKSRGVPFPVSISAYDLDGRLISNYSNPLAITATGDAGTITRSPGVITFAAGTWNGNMTLNTVSENVRLRVSYGTAYTGTSDAFNVIQGGPAQYLWSSIGASPTAGQPFTATITARDALNAAMPNHTGYVVLSSPAAERVIGSGTTTSSSFPLYTYYHDQRTQVIYPASEVGGAGTLSSLSLYITTLPGQTLNAWTIRMKQTALASYSTSAWESSGWTTVYSANQTLTQTGWVTFNFSTPFTHNGTSNLMVDFSFNNSTYTTAGAVRTFTTGANRTIQAASDSSYGSPLTWSATSPYPSTSSTVPQIKLNSGTIGSSVHPATVLLTNGSWTGSLRMGAATPSTSISATDFASITGKSATFAVLASPDSDGDGLPDFWETANSLATGNNNGDNGAQGDPDADGIPNFLEYALNLNPHAASTTGLPYSVKMINPVDGQDYLEFTYRRRIGAPGITYTIETSADCVTWSSSTAQYQNAAGPLATGDGVSEIVTVRVLPKMNAPGTSMKYVRLRVGGP
jgi:Fungalysin metallopeptidase (M36)/Viral BACON domain/Fungalysin/Thermolysin Propeptide Motif